MEQASGLYTIDGDTLTILSGRECPYKCAYCYTYVSNFLHPEKRELTKTIAALKTIPENVRLIRVGCDTEEFLVESDGLELIAGLSVLERDISFATKKDLSLTTVHQLKDIAERMEYDGEKNLVAFVSLIGIETARELESYAPPPEKRIETVEKLYQSGLPVFVYMKPLLPTIPDGDIDELIKRTIGKCTGYVCGSLKYDEELASKLGLTQTEREGCHSLVFPARGEWFSFSDERIAHLLKILPNAFRRSRDAVTFIRERNVRKV